MSSRPRRLSALLLPLTIAGLLFACPAHGQLAHEGAAKAIALSQTLPPYDVSSIKQNKTGVQSWGMNINDDVFTANNVPLKAIIEFAYDIKQDLIVGLNGPVSSVSFDVTAKILPSDGGPPPKLKDSQLQAMIIPLLADRFHLKAHLEPKTVPVYDLVVAHGGPRVTLDQSERTGSSWNINSQNTSTVLTGKNDSMADLADALSDLAGRKVIDKTGLTGAADITLKWSDDVAAEQGGSNVVSIFTALEEQLGLKLQPSKGPVDTLVIDHVDMPTEN
jgi:bla regulator protein BlaR1